MESKNLVEATEKFESWAVVEMFGHQRIAGRVTEQTIGGAALIRVDVPDTQGKHGYTKFLGNGAIYAITPCSEDAARFNAEHIERYSQPIPYEPPKQLQAATVDADFESGEENDDDDRPF